MQKTELDSIPSRLYGMWVVLLLPLLGGSTAAAQDVTFHNASTSFGPLSQETVYRLGQDSVTATVQFQACQDLFGSITDVDAAIDVVATGAGPGSAIEVARVNVSSVPSCFGCTISGCTPTVVPIQIDGNHGGIPFEDWVSSFIGDGFDLALRIRLDPDDVIFETDELDNETTNVSTFDLIPVSGTLGFGPTSTTLGVVTAATGVGICGVDEVGLLSGTTSWDPSPGPNWDPLDVPVAGICASVQGASAPYDLVTETGGAITGPIAATANGFSVELAAATLNASGAHPVGPLSVDMPEGHSLHAANASGAPEARGERRLQLESVAPLIATDFALLTGDSTSTLWLRSGGLPFFFEASNFSLAGSQFRAFYSNVMWAYDQAWAPTDQRHLSRRGPTSNDVRYSRAAASQPNSLLLIESTGVRGEVTFDSGQGTTHFPRMSHQFDNVQIQFEAGRITDGWTVGFIESYAFRQSADCGACNAGSSATADRDYVLSTTNGQAVGDDGGVLTTISQLGTNPAFGTETPDILGTRNRFQRDSDSVFPSTLYLPGFEARSTGGTGNIPVHAYLLGMREGLPPGIPGTTHLLGSSTAKRGNEFAAGVTVGPQTYRNAFGLAEVGLGADLAGSSTDIAFGASGDIDVQAAISNSGTKYVIRPGGITGAFNSDPSHAPDPTVYGYALDLRRFAFRTVMNQIDPITWVDGQIDIPGKGGFGISFASLDLGCGGELGAGLVVREACDGTDNDGNGVIDDNCDETLRAWRTDYDVVSMDFVPTNPALMRCTSADRELSVVSNIDVHAIGQSMGLTSSWSPGGEPVSPRLTGGTDQELDRPIAAATDKDDTGFMIAFDDRLEMRSINADEGWFEAAGSIPLPFWNALDVKVRVENASPTTPSQTIVVNSGYGLPLESNSDAIQTVSADAGSDSSAEYTWGSTGYGIGPNVLPIFYEPGRFASQRPRFLGVDNPVFDVVVADLRAGVNFVDPLATKVSFGASADFQKIAALEIDLNIDLNSDESVAEIDAFLASIGVSGNPTSDLVGEIRDKSNLLNGVIDAGLDGFLEEAVTSAIGAIDFAPISDAMGIVQSIPEQMASVVADQLSGVVDQVVDPLSGPLDAAALDLYLNWPTLIVDANNGSPDLTALAAGLDQLNDANDALGEVEVALGEVTRQVDDAEAAFNDAFAQTATWVADAQAEIGNLTGALGPVTNLTQCGSGNPLRTQVGEVQTRIDDFVNVLEAVELERWAGLINSVIGVDLSAITSAERDIRDLAEDLSQRVGAAQSELGGILGSCAGVSYTAVLGDVNLFLNDLDAEIDLITAGMASLQHELQSDPGLFSLVRDEVALAAERVGQVRILIGDLEAATESILDGEAADGFASHVSPGAIQTELDQRMLDLTKGAFTWYYPPGAMAQHTFVQELATYLRQPVDQAIADVAAAVQIQLGTLGALLPHPSPEDFEDFLVDLVMNSPVVEAIDTFTQQFLSEITTDLNGVSLLVFDQLNSALQDLFERLEGAANEAILAATAPISDLPLVSAKLDGFALIAGDELERMHIGAEFNMLGGDDSSSSRFEAALDVASWSANGKAQGCLVDGSALLDAVISTRNLPIEIGPSDILIKKLYLGFTLENLAPRGVFGGIDTEGAISFEAFQINDIAFHAGVGSEEVYLGAAAGALLESVQLDVAFLVGRTCNLEVLHSLDPQAAEFIELPNNRFEGVFVRGSGSIPLITGGCPLTIGVGADAGAWLLLDSPITIGGVVGGAAYGEALCIAALRGQVTAFGQKSGDQFSFQGTGFGVAGVGFDCDPATWTSVERSRGDDWCGTGDARVSIRFKDSWDFDPPSTSAIH